MMGLVLAPPVADSEVVAVSVGKESQLLEPAQHHTGGDALYRMLGLDERGRRAAHRRHRRSRSDCLDGQEPLKANEIGRIFCVKGKAIDCSSGGDQQIGQSGSTGSYSGSNGSEYATIHPWGIRIERQRIPGFRSPLPPVLAQGSLLGVFRSVQFR